ncbi:hypothetical protein G3A_13805 [Bacillus sp. 17376]|uniref:Chromosome partition protein smc n=1 Tax=Mesobacillus boroniphilus JCM 21738 TaxID=1294265 RepID=W4RPL2_9BACI|nr:hypothetical protein [Mesobacillus boroniphilus]ESU31976.1 hypothetical protein G3A_13805 [Bacillus sp. 17376]GAE45539.1 hypothetical protein JCM21738_2357 [Mesobacillus boroniphilus JCM 21738]
MEKILNKILDRLDSMDKRFDSVDARFESMEDRFESSENRFDNLEKGQQTILSEQSEMRREMGFYYGSLMKKLDETKIELSSEIKHVSNVQKQHQDVLEILNEKQQ